jgi:hypothetical protein
LGNGLTRVIWDHENPGSNPGCPTSVFDGRKIW